ncbi:carbohydrate kinase family protein [Leeuwenhoekiella polynyae]|uniref:Fructokinase n=1 Tax=Leeuwenhoekiella polynyae TaxID=1550906 RepID=A0A4Q0P2Y0_9FLAO|nr:PfkB family carbohydrate kinase [Leeuwenhoekiella polynyae]RXG18569.1 fructokinase [Leeuwenhoekiella polynyae]
MKKEIDIICVGEILLDFIGIQENVSLSETESFQRFLGGSPTNVAVNTKRLGLNSRLICAIGKDGLGDFVLQKLNDLNLNTEGVAILDDFPTSVIFVSKTTGTPDFIAYREADKELVSEQLPTALLKQAKIFHTTCFALSKIPAQQAILRAAKEASELGLQLSIDVNYSERIWPDREEGLRVIKVYCSYNPLVKISEDDMFRLFAEHKPHQEIFDFFHTNGVDLVCLTLGAEGVKLSRKGNAVITLPALKLEFLADATGAGDAFWSGFLYSYLQKVSDKKAAETALKLAALKLQHLGVIPSDIDVLTEIS